MTIKLFHLKNESELRSISPTSANFNYEDQKQKKQSTTRSKKRMNFYGSFDNWLNIS